MAKIPDIPSTQDVPSGTLGWIKNWLDTARLWVQTRDPNSTSVGDSLDKFVDRRLLVDNGILLRKSDGSYRVGIGSIPGPKGDPGSPGSPGTYTPDYTPPPTPTGLTVTAGLTQLIIEWTAPSYTQGHGNGQTNIYGAVWTDPATEPTFGDVRTKLIDSAVGTTSITSYGTPLGTRWCIWIKFQSQDGIESTSPAGGTHGVQATTGKIGGADLNDLIITAEKLSQGTYPNINLVPNPGSEDGIVAWAVNRASGGGTATFTASTSDKVGGTSSFKVSKASAGLGRGITCSAFPVIPGETYAVKLRVRANAASAAGLHIVMEEGAAKPPTNFLGVNATGTDLVTARDSQTPLATDTSFTSGWGTYKYTYTVPAGVYWASLAIYSWTTGTNVDMYVDDCSVGRQITAEFMAANAIAVGSAAIQNGAIVNAMIGTAAIDNAKIANVSAAKITAGSLQVGSYLRSTVYTPGSAGWTINADGTAELGAAYIRGQLTAAQINTNGLTIRDAGGNIILDASGSGSLDWRFVASQPGPNLIANPEFANDANGTVTPQGWTNGVSGTATQNQIFRPTGSPSYGAPWNLNAPVLYAGVDAPSEFVRWSTADFIEINENENYTLACWARDFGASDTHVYLGCQCYDNAGGSLGNVYPTLSLSTLTATWTRYPGTIGPAGAVAWPAGTAKVKVRWLGAYNTGATSYTGSSFATRFTFNQGLNPTNSYLPFDPSAVTAYNQITGANAAVYIASAAIGWAQIGDLNINTSGAIHSGQTAYDTGTGYYFEYNGGTPRASFGSATKGFLWDGSNFLVRGNVIATGNLISGSVTGSISGSVTGIARTTSTQTSRVASKTIGSISTSSGGDGRVMLFVFPSKMPTAAGWEYFSYLAEASLAQVYGDTFLIRFEITRTIGAAVTVIWSQEINFVGSSTATATRFCYFSFAPDTPGVGVTATYKLVVTTTTTGAATPMAREILDFNYALMEFKK